MRIDIHIGHNKTGTSQFQYLMANSEEKLAEQNILYPSSGQKFNAHHGLVRLLVSQRVKKSTEPTTTYETFLDEIRGKNLDRVVLSSEGFILTKTAKDTFEALMKEFDVHVHLFLRPPISWVNSMLNQRYKNLLHQAKDLSVLQKTESLITQGMQFQNRIKTWEDIVGLDRMNVHFLEKGSDYLEEILTGLDIKLTSEHLKKDTANSSVNADALCYLSWLAQEKENFSVQEKIKLNKILREYSLASERVKYNLIPPDLYEPLKQQAEIVRGIISEKYADGRDVLQEPDIEGEYVDIENYDDETISKVNCYVLKSLLNNKNTLNKTSS